MKAATDTMRDNPGLDEAAIINELGVGEAIAKSAVRTIGTQVCRQILRGVMCSILGET